MSDNGKLQGAVVISSLRHSHGVIELLTYRLRSRLHLTYYYHPYEVETAAHHRFIIVFSPQDLSDVVKCYDVKHVPVPLLVHIDTPDVLARMNYAAWFPHVEIVPVEQANLTEKDVTLRITLFQEIIERLEARVGH